MKCPVCPNKLHWWQRKGWRLGLPYHRRCLIKAYERATARQQRLSVLTSEEMINVRNATQAQAPSRHRHAS